MSVVKKRLIAGGMAFLFVVATLVAWWLFASLAARVVSCVNWGGGSLKDIFPENCATTLETQDWQGRVLRIGTLMLSLMAAIWVSMRGFFTAPTFEPATVGADKGPDEGGSTDPATAERS